ncbi:hypothetical protein E4U38_008101, partial [Claviceps purpurea]
MDSLPSRRCSACKSWRPITDFPLKRGADSDDPDAERLRTCQPCKTSRLQRRERQRRSREATPGRAASDEAGEAVAGNPVLRRCNSCKNRRPITDFPLKRGADPDDPDAERIRTCQPCKDARHQRRQRQRAAREEPPNDAERRRCSSCRNTRPLADFPPKRGADPDDPNPERALT